MLFSSWTSKSLIASSSRGLHETRFSMNSMRCMASLSHRRWQAKLRRQAEKLPSPKPMPDASLAMSMPVNVREMDNQTLITLAAMNDHPACREMLVRHIMNKDKLDYQGAIQKFQEMDTFHQKQMSAVLFPYQVGIVTATVAAFASFPLCFHLPTVHWFNHHFVTADIPEPQDLETMLEVGSWAWNWMEPPLGQTSFFLLCLQFSR
jgi:hypothetical protein